MALIYEMSTGIIVSENTGITTIENHAEVPEYHMALQPLQSAPQAGRRPDDAYISLIKELLKDL